MRKLIVIASLFLVISQDLFAATYWAKTTGNDTTGDGSEGNPFLTIQAAADATSSGADDVCVGDGTYTKGFVMAEGTTTGYVGHFSGTAENPVTVSNCEGGVVKIDLGETVSTWVDQGGNLWKSGAVTSTTSAHFWRGDTPLANLKQSNCANVNAEGRWCIDGSNLVNLYTTNDPSDETFKLNAASNNGAIQIRDISYVTIDGIDVDYSPMGYGIGTSFSAPLGLTEYITIKNSSVQHSGSRGIRLVSSETHHTENIIIELNEIKYTSDASGSDNGHCIKLDSNTDGYRTGPVEIKNNTLEACWYHGIQVSNTWQNVSIHNNTVVDTSVKGSGLGTGIRCGDVDGCQIYDNHIYANNVSLGTGIYLQDAPTDVLVYGNEIHGFDWHGIYVFNSSGNGIENAKIYNNIIYDNEISGIRIDKSISIAIDNNTIIDSGSSTSSGAIDLNTSNADGVTIRNNIMSSSGKLALRTATGSTIVEDKNNLFWRDDAGDLIKIAGVTKIFAEYQSDGYSVNSKNQDPLLDTAGNLYVPLALSPARNSGKPLKSIFTTDYDGTARGNTWDMGAHEVSTEVIFDGITIN